MSIFPNRKIFAIPAVVALMALAVPIASVQAEGGDDWFSSPGWLSAPSPVFTTSFVALAGGDYAWLVDVSPPAPALLSEYYADENQEDAVPGVTVPIPTKEGDPGWSTAWDTYLNGDNADVNAAKLLTVNFNWADGTASGGLPSDAPMNEPSAQGQVRCDNSATLVAGTWVPSPSFGRVCTAEGRHTYVAGTQGVKEIIVTATQGEQSSTTRYDQFVLDPSAGGSLIGKGTLLGRDGGMYDTDFATSDVNKTVTFNINAKRPSGTTSTQASILVTAPGMLPDAPGGAASNGAKGMTFKGSAPMMQMVVTKTGTTTEVTLERVEGRVTNTLADGTVNDAGGAWAWIHVKAEKGKPTLMRIRIDNTSAGYTYLDTGDVETPWMEFNSDAVLLSGSVKVG